jgi:GH25 family lysozyme M1 (1,4-beta-N-acetylmuramidase)
MANCFGIDASHYQSLSQDGLRSAKAAGCVWFTHKASEGTSMTDDDFGSAINWAKNAELWVGSYHVVRSSPSIDSQGNYFLNAISRHYDWRADPAFIFQVDLEKWSYDAVPGSLGVQFAQWLLDNTGSQTVFLYASKGQYGNEVNNSPVRLWNANYPTWQGNGCPSEPYDVSYNHSGGDSGPGWASYSGQTPTFWQYSDNASFGGVYGVDANAFKGTEADFAALIGAKPSTPAVKEEDMGMLALDPITGQTYLCIGFQSNPVADESLNDIKYLAGQGAYSIQRAPDNANPAEWSADGWIRLGWTAENFGPVPGAITLSDDQVDDIAQTVADAVVEAVGESVGLTYDEVVAASKQAAREGATEASA